MVSEVSDNSAFFRILNGKKVKFTPFPPQAENTFLLAGQTVNGYLHG